MTRLKGFTLLELIIAMAIVAVLIGLSVIGIQTVQRSQRDTERRAYLNTINLEITAYYGDTSTYPATVTITGTPRITVNISANRTVTLKGAAVSLAASATASTSQGSKYCYGVSGNDYVIGVHLEGSNAFTYYGNLATSSCAGL